MSDNSVGRKNDEGKLRYDLVPPEALEEIVKVYTMGAKKYDDRNWEKGIAWSRIYAALMRHVQVWWAGEDYAPDDGQHHMASAGWCALALLHYSKFNPEFDDRPRRKVVTND